MPELLALPILTLARVLSLGLPLALALAIGLPQMKPLLRVTRWPRRCCGCRGRGAAAAMAPEAAALLLLLLGWAQAVHGAPPLRPLQLFMHPVEDTVEAWGLITPRITPLVRASNGTARGDPVRLPPLHSGNLSTGAQIFGALPTHGEPGSFSVYVQRIAEATGAGEIVRYRSSDLISWAPLDGEVALRLPLTINGSHASWVPKSIAVDPATGRHVLIIFDGGHRAYVFTANSSGLQFVPTTPFGEPAFVDHDDSNLLFQTEPAAGSAMSDGGGEFVDLQITFQPWKKKYEDNACMPAYLPNCVHARRVLAVRRSTDQGLTFSADGPIRVPDSSDPPEVEYYRFRPFLLGDSGRRIAMVLLYTPSPWNVNPIKWGCLKGNSSHDCHGPHIMNEWWLGPADGNASDLEAW